MSMRVENYLKSLFVMMAMVAIVGCNNDEPPQDRPVGGDEQLCSASVEVVSITDTTLEFSITSENADKVCYVFAESSETAPSEASIIADGTEVEVNKTVNVKFEELAPSTKYTLHVAAENSLGSTYAHQEAETDEADAVYEPTISIVVGECGQTTAKFTVTTTHATDVYYVVCDLTSEDEETTEGELPSVEEVFAAGSAIEANVAAEVEVTNLEAGSQYIIVVAAEGEGGSVVEAENFNTIYPEPVLSASLTEDIGPDYAVFNVATENVAEVKYVCIKAGSRDVTAEQVLKNGTAVEVGDVKIEGLDEETAYEVYVAAKGLNEAVVMADVLSFTTEKQIKNYLLIEGITASSYKYGDDNYFVTFVDEKNGYILNVDFYTDNSQPYLTSAVYPLDGANACKIGAAHTKFFFSPADKTGETFAYGDLEVIATPNEDTREINYTIGGILSFANGDYVYLSFDGVISGISLPAVVEGAPEGAHIFEVKESIQPTRYTGNVVPGEYYIKFTDNDGGEFRFDLLLDPAICDNGNAVLPTGTYTTEQFNLSYTDFVTYRPSYKTWTFSAIEVDVVTEGETHTIIVNATMTNGGDTKPFYMNWSGEIKVQ